MPVDESRGGSLRELVARGAAMLAVAGVESPRLTAELLLAHALGCDRIRILSHGEEAYPAGLPERYQELLCRRCEGEPLHYIQGEREFYGLSFRVTPAVLIPRPETELMIEKALQLAAARAGARLLCADIGTGSGCIAITLARNLRGARVWATDISREALAIARINAARHAVRTVEFVCGDLMSCFRPLPTFDLVLANLPYISCAEAGGLPVTVSGFEPHLALFAGDSGLEFYLRLIPQAVSRLAVRGCLLMEVGQGQAERAARRVAAAGLEILEVAADLQGIPRCIIAMDRGAIR